MGYVQVLVDSYLVAQFDTFDQAREAALEIEAAFLARGNQHAGRWQLEDDSRFAVGPYWRSILPSVIKGAPQVVIEAGEFDVENGAIPAPPQHYLERVAEGLRSYASRAGQEISYRAQSRDRRQADDGVGRSELQANRRQP